MGHWDGCWRTPSSKSGKTKFAVQSQPCLIGPCLFRVRFNPELLSILTLCQAKPGFGKTVLCATIIEHLAKRSPHGLPLAQEISDSVCYYFFDKRRGSLNSPMDALRAVLAQLIHFHRKVDPLRKLATEIKSNSKQSQSQATDKEVVEMLVELLRHLEATFLVFDGVDECSDYADFLRGVTVVGSSGSCALLLTSRPSVELPKQLSKTCQTLHLNFQENTDDIRRILLPEIEDLIQNDLLRTDLSAECIATLISSRANGMFLWARLLIEYLRLPVWTLRERQDAIFSLNRLEGLDALYDAILASLKSQFPRKSHSTIMRIFQWVMRARRPLEIKELAIAVSIPLDRPHSSIDSIPDFGRNLGRLTGSLVEVTQNGLAQFIHLSLLEFFTAALHSSALDETPNATAASYCEGADRDLVVTCVSYLRHTVPAEPLAGSSRITPTANATEHKYPFLRYSAVFWSDHLADSLETIQNPQATSDRKAWKLLADLILAIVNDRNRVTVWIEASWLFGYPRIQTPSENAERALNSLTSKIPSFALLGRATERMYRLSKEIVDLNRSWRHVLASEPNEIWEPSISTFTKSQFWVDSDKSRLIRLAPLTQDSPKCITVQSQIADSGSELGVVRLFPPR